MARKKAPGTPHVTVVTAAPPQEPDERPANEQADDAVIDQASSELPTQAKARLYRSHPATGNREAFVDSIDASMFSQDYVRDNYGGGRYRVQFFGPRDGKVAYIKQTQFDVDLTIPPKVPGVGVAAQAPAASASNAPQGSSALDMAIVSMLTTMMQNMSAQQNQQAEATRAMTAMQMQMMKDHSTMLAAQLAQLGQKPDRDPFDMVKDLAALIKPEPTRSLREELETLQMLKEITGDSAGETSWLDVVKELAPPLLQNAANANRPERVRRPARMVDGSGAPLTAPVEGPGQPARVAGSGAPDGGGVAAPTPGAEAPNVEVMPSLKFVAPIIPKLVKWAGQGRPPALCAEWQLSEIPEGFYPMLREQLSAPSLLDDLGQAFPATIPVRAWIEEFRAAMLELMEPESEHDGDDDIEVEPEEVGDDEPE